MRKIGKIIVLLLLLTVTLRVDAFAVGGVVPIDRLINQEDHYDKSAVTVQGEAIGEPMDRGSECWVNLNDGTNAIGIKMKAAEAKRIQKYGKYRQEGDTVRVTGVFYKACPDDGGETDIHATDVQIISCGKTVPEDVPSLKIAAAVALAALMAFSLLLCWRKRLIFYGGKQFGGGR